jgi:ABC-type spermidine/putrescine transport system permease subunit II
MAFLFAPAIIVVLFAFNSENSTSKLYGLSTRWFSAALGNADFVAALTNSVKAAVFTALFVVVAGTLAALALVRMPSRVSNALTSFFTVPIIIPGLFFGVALLSFFSRVQLPLSMLTIVVGHVLITLPLVVLIVGARLQHLDMSILEAARDLGANSWQAFHKVLLPLIAPALVGSALLAVAWSLDEFIITLFMNGGTQTVPVLIFGRLRLGIDPSINAIAAILLLVTTAVTVIAGKFVSVSEVTG